MPRRGRPDSDGFALPDPDSGEGVHFAAPKGMFRCPNGHDLLGALHIEGIAENVDGDYCMACYWQFVSHHTPKVELIEFED